MLSLGSMISPKAGMSILKSAIEKTIDQKIETFQVVYNHENKCIDFVLFNVTVEGKFHERLVSKYADGKRLCDIFAAMLTDNMKPDELKTLKFCVVSFPANTYTVYRMVNGEKIKDSKSL